MGCDKQGTVNKEDWPVNLKPIESIAVFFIYYYYIYIFDILLHIRLSLLNVKTANPLLSNWSVYNNVYNVQILTINW